MFLFELTVQLSHNTRNNSKSIFHQKRSAHLKLLILIGKMHKMEVEIRMLSRTLKVSIYMYSFLMLLPVLVVNSLHVG